MPEHDQLTDGPSVLPPLSPQVYATLEQWQVLHGVADELIQERQAQDAQWGEQNHPLGFGARTYKGMADLYRKECDEAHQRGELTWRHILLEEFYEALAEGDPAKARDELIQVGAVVMAAIERIDRMTPQEAGRA